MIIGLISIIVLIGLDQGTKYLMKEILTGSKTIVAIPNLLEFNYYENTGAAFGSFQGHQLLFFGITIVVLLVLGYLFTKVDFSKKKVYSISLVLLIAGTLGNAIDRLILGYVIDFLHMPFIQYILFGNNFIFNLADAFLTFGVILFAIDILFLEDKRKKKTNEAI
ncbi:Lipoprotein signal peptidase [Alteracholeplasma palmae J233]|uniref:Lipoprotein signal peptidase n=1 Tax=Alteracholeplasma palmae (strain ATCC 49389 / J233) TaxID=1318466 RepID=U4KL80_ALTPJ|nr:signal peptidase II [Alteracholeplasma palmae]CCV64537.1 Lipoprotein signal peptidase [Alteracholeplasma palmae J233]